MPRIPKAPKKITFKEKLSDKAKQVKTGATIGLIQAEAKLNQALNAVRKEIDKAKKYKPTPKAKKVAAGAAGLGALGGAAGLYASERKKKKERE